MNETRDAILRVAERAFAERSHAVPLEEIARRAGVSRATVYRHFPHRYALATAVSARWFELLRATIERDDRGLRDVLAETMWIQVRMGSLISQLKELPVPVLRGYARRYVDLLAPAFQRVQQAGGLRPDARPSDLLLVLAMLDSALANARTAEQREQRARLAIPLLLDGLFRPPV